MKILMTADIHNGLSGKLKDTTWCMDIMRQYASEHDIEHVFVLGDLFHDRQNLGIDVICRVYDQLKLTKEQGQNWVCFPGNHDMYLKNSWSINSLKPLEQVLQVYDQITQICLGGQNFTIVPFIHYEDKYMEQINQIKCRDNEILLTHIGVHNATLNECFLLKHWSIVDFINTPFKRIYTGHFHCHQKVGDNVWFTGSPIPYRFDEGVVDHGFIVFDTDNGQHEFIKIYDICANYSDYRAPNYLTIIDKDLPNCLHLLKGNHVKLILSKEYTPHELKKIRQILKNKGALQVRWKNYDRKIDEAQHVQSKLVNLSNPTDIFKSWLEHDQPKLDKDLLLELHQQVIDDAKHTSDEEI